MVMLIFLVNTFVGLLIFSSSRKHLLATLLSLEMMVLGVFLCFFFHLGYSVIFCSLIYLVYTSCEGALGLTILVSMSRGYGGDYFSSLILND